MTTKTNYEAIVNAHNLLKAKYEEEQNALKEALLPLTHRLQHQAYVGNSVLKKKFGVQILRDEHYSFLGDLGKFLKNSYTPIVTVGDETIDFGAFKIDRKVISISDRDFAKIIRQEVAKFKASEKKKVLTHHQAELQKVSVELKQKQKELKDLEGKYDKAQEIVTQAEEYGTSVDKDLVKYNQAIEARRQRRQKLKAIRQYHVESGTNAVRRCASGSDSCLKADESAHFTSREAAENYVS